MRTDPRSWPRRRHLGTRGDELDVADRESPVPAQLVRPPHRRCQPQPPAAARRTRRAWRWHQLSARSPSPRPRRERPSPAPPAVGSCRWKTSTASPAPATGGVPIAATVSTRERARSTRVERRNARILLVLEAQSGAGRRAAARPEDHPLAEGVRAAAGAGRRSHTRADQGGRASRGSSRLTFRPCLDSDLSQRLIVRSIEHDVVAALTVALTPTPNKSDDCVD
jgi:hypothetical protein